MSRDYGQYCGLARALDVVGDRWNLLIVRELLIRARAVRRAAGGAIRHRDEPADRPAARPRNRRRDRAAIVRRQQCDHLRAHTVGRAAARPDQWADSLVDTADGPRARR